MTVFAGCEDRDASQGSMASVTLEEAHGGASRLDKSFARCMEEQATTGTVTKPLSDEYRVAVVAAGRAAASDRGRSAALD